MRLGQRWGRERRPDWRVVRQVASWCLEYPDAEFVQRLPLLREALAEQPGSTPVTQLGAFLDHVEAVSTEGLVDEYVRLFDLSRHQTLYLSYWTDGDTRRRGSTLTEFKQHYRDSGFLCDTGGELPDHLPMVLEYAAVADPDGGQELLQEYRASLELIRLSLLERETPYAEILAAVCATLPGASPRTRSEAMALAPAHLRSGQAGPPTESVGIEMLGYPSVGPPAAAPHGTPTAPGPAVTEGAR